MSLRLSIVCLELLKMYIAIHYTGNNELNRPHVLIYSVWGVVASI